MSKSKKIQITLIKSLNGRLKSHKDCARGLGIRRINKPVTVEETPENLGMINKINYMLKVERT